MRIGARRSSVLRWSKRGAERMSNRLPTRSIYLGSGQAAERVWSVWSSFIAGHGFPTNTQCLEWLLQLPEKCQHSHWLVLNMFYTGSKPYHSPSQGAAWDDAPSWPMNVRVYILFYAQRIHTCIHAQLSYIVVS